MIPALLLSALASPPEVPTATEDPRKVRREQKEAERERATAAVDVLKSTFDGPPAPGVVRCRSRSPDVVWIAKSYWGGPPPAIGMATRTETLYVDRVPVVSSRESEGLAGTGPALRIRRQEAEMLEPRTIDGVYVNRDRSIWRIERADGQALKDGVTEVTATMTCEAGVYPPPP